MRPRHILGTIVFVLLLVALVSFVANEVGYRNSEINISYVIAGNVSCEALGCDGLLVGSKTSNKYHRCDCPHALRIKPENLICFHTLEEAQALGYQPCSVCISNGDITSPSAGLLN